MSSFFQFFVYAFLAGMLALSCATAHGQAGQYQRSKKSTPPAAPAADPAAKGEKPAEEQPADPNKKVDISDLEQKYWAPKDTEFSVVQNRTYTKAGRFAATLSFGSLINDQYNKAAVNGLAVNYYISERMGLELDYINIPSVDNKMTEKFLGDNGLAPDHNKQRKFMGASFTWIPIYAKISLLEKKIVYFDMSFSPGIGVMSYDHVKKPSQFEAVSYESASAMAFTFDVSQHFFINQNFALRVDVKNQFYNEKVNAARSPFDEKETRGVSSTLVLFGLTYYH